MFLQYRLSVLLLVSCIFLAACIGSKKLLEREKTDSKTLLFSRNKGNCLACHVIEDGELAGNIGPELKNLSQKFDTKTQLRDFIWNASVFNPKTAMPPFGKNKILTMEEIDLIVNYLWKL